MFSFWLLTIDRFHFSTSLRIADLGNERPHILAVLIFHGQVVVGANPTPTEGARLGWITGIITFTLSLVLGAVASLAGEGFGPALDQMQQQLRENNEVDMADAIARMAGDPTTLATVIVIGLVLTFLVVTALTTLGGALGARVLQDE